MKKYVIICIARSKTLRFYAKGLYLTNVLDIRLIKEKEDRSYKGKKKYFILLNYRSFSLYSQNLKSIHLKL